MEQLALIPPERMTPREANLPISQLLAEPLVCEPPDAAFIASIKHFGILQPIVVLEYPDHYTVAAGRRRILGAQAAKLTEVPARIYNGSWVSPAVLTIIENDQRKVNILADLEAIQHLRKLGANDDDIILATGLLPQTIKAREQLLLLRPELRQALEQGRMKVSVANLATRLTWEQQGRLVELLETQKRIRAQDVQAARQVQAAALPATLFSTPGIEDEPPEQPSHWATQVVERLRVIRAFVPSEELTIHNMLGRLEQRITKEL